MTIFLYSTVIAIGITAKPNRAIWDKPDGPFADDRIHTFIAFGDSNF